MSNDRSQCSLKKNKYRRRQSEAWKREKSAELYPQGVQSAFPCTNNKLSDEDKKKIIDLSKEKNIYLSQLNNNEDSSNSSGKGLILEQKIEIPYLYNSLYININSNRDLKR